MRSSIRYLATLVLASAITFPCHANTAFNGLTVTDVGAYGNGAIFIFLNSPINEPGCNANATRIDIPASDPNLKQILAIAMAALTGGTQISGAVNGCDPDDGNPTLDQSSN